MSETMEWRQSAESTPIHQELEHLVQKVVEQVTDIIDDGSQDECARIIAELQCVISTYNYLQAGLSHQLEKQVYRDHEERGVYMYNPAKGAASTVALARKQSPRGFRSRLEGYRILFEDTPNLANAFFNGFLAEDQIDRILRELKNVGAEYRVEFDDLFGTHPEMFEGKAKREVNEVVRKFTLKYLCDEESVKLQNAADKQYLRFYRDGDMIRFSGALPTPLGVPLREELRQGSFNAKRHGDKRTRTQIEAELLVGNLVAGQHRKLPLHLSIGLILTDRTLFMGDREPAFMEGYGYISSQVARELIAGAFRGGEHDIRKMREGEYEDYLEHLETVADIVRLYTAPGGTELVAMDSKARAFPEGLRKFIRVRDRNCRTPYCDGLVEEADHILQHHLGGATSADNGAGRCGICNQAKEKIDWNEYVALKHPQTAVIKNAGMHYISQAPPIRGWDHDPFPKLISDAQWLKTYQRRKAA